MLTATRAAASKMRHRARFPACSKFTAMRLLPLMLCGATIVSLVGCQTSPATKDAAASASASQPAAPTRQPPPNPATKAASAKANLAIEKLRLADLFRGTPVVFSLQPDGSLRAEVPLQFSFDPGKAVVKPPLGAVLDRIATGQRDEITVVLVAAPGDPAVKSAALAGERSASVRDYLLTRGLAQTRVKVVAPIGAANVRIVVTDTPAP